jgi:hypothetical protein
MTRTVLITPFVEALLAGGVAADVIERALDIAKLHGQTQGKALTTTTTQRRGTRLSENWQPSERCIAYALDHGMSRDRIATETEKYKNYWSAKSGASATKLNWEAVWRNWILTALEQRHGTASHYRSGQHGASPIAGRASTGADAVLAGMGRIAKRIVEKRNAAGPSDRQVARGTDIAEEFDLEPNRT